MGHRFFHDCEAMDHACYAMDATLAPFIARWRKAGYEVIVTADHGQDARGHHGGTGEDQRDFALYYFGESALPPPDVVLDQLALAPSILTRMAVPVPASMTAVPFLSA
jgi:predicted AlkP superfamily pyrophosphatase or phosphodiesterase